MSAIDLTIPAIRIFMCHDNNHMNLTPEELAFNINNFFIRYIRFEIPELSNFSDQTPENLQNYDFDHDNIYNEQEVKSTLEGLIEFMSQQTSNTEYTKNHIMQNFNNYFTGCYKADRYNLQQNPGVDLNIEAIRIFMAQHNNHITLTSEEFANNINKFIRNDIFQEFPEIQNFPIQSSQNLTNYDINEDGIFDENQVKMTLESLIEFISQQTSNMQDSKARIMNSFNSYFSRCYDNLNENIPVNEAQNMPIQQGQDEWEQMPDYEESEVHRRIDDTIPYELDEQLNSIYKKITIFNPINYEDEDALTFLNENIKAIPFIIKFEDGTDYIGCGMKWPTSDREFIECTDDAPDKPQGNYRIAIDSEGRTTSYIKENARIFVKLLGPGAGNILVERPTWWGTTNVPEPKIFNLKSAGSVFKFIRLEWASPQGVRPGENMTSAVHCNQKEPQNVYTMEEMDIGELVGLFGPSGGKRKTHHVRRNKTKNKSKKRMQKSNKNKNKGRKSKSNKSLKKKIVKSKKTRKLRI